MTYVSEQSSQELRAHMRRLKNMNGWHEPLADRLFKEVTEQDAEIERLCNIIDCGCNAIHDAVVVSGGDLKRIDAIQSRMRLEMFDEVSCDRCNGTGVIDAAYSGVDPSCPDCDGEGWIESRVRAKGGPENSGSGRS